MMCLLISTVLLVLAAVVPAGAQQSQNQPVLVGHIDYIEGSLLRYVPETKDWVATVKDAPFGLQDALYTDPSARAEIIMPNTTMLRIGGSTQAQLLRLASDSTEIDIASGKARFYNTGTRAIIRATTPFGQVVAPAGAVFDLYVGDDSVEVIAIKSTVEYVHPSGSTKYPVQPGSSSIIANRSQVTAGEGLTDAAWNNWNLERDGLWQNRAAKRGDSGRYMPPELYPESYVLEETGRWERVYYEGGYRNFWRPAYVSAGWSPYTHGRWTYWYGDHCWIPAEPFGYVTHHYGTWVYVDSARFWYWSPPVASIGVTVGGPSYAIGLSWYPGRVSWIYNETYIGWVPLAPYEPYYCHNYWGPSAVVVSIDFYDDHRHHRGHDNHGRHHYEDHAVVVNQNNFYTVNNYSNNRIGTVDRGTISRSYKGSPVANNRVIKKNSDLLQKYNFADINVRQKPHQTVRDRIQQNLAGSRREGRQGAPAIMERLERMKTGSPAAKAPALNRPQQVTDRLVSARDANKPKSMVPFTTRELKPSGTVRPAQTDIRPQPRTSQPAPGQQPEQPRKPIFTKPGQQEAKPDRQPDRGVTRPEPARPGVQRPDRDGTAAPERPKAPIFTKPDQQEAKPDRQPDRGVTRPEPARPGVQRPDRDAAAAPERPKAPIFSRPDQQEAKPDRQPDRGVTRPEPARPGVQRPDRDGAAAPERPKAPIVTRPDQQESRQPRQRDMEPQRPTYQQQRPSAQPDKERSVTTPQRDESSSRTERFQPREQPRSIERPAPSYQQPRVERSQPQVQPRTQTRSEPRQPSFSQPQRSSPPAQPAPGRSVQPQQSQPGRQQGFQRWQQK